MIRVVEIQSESAWALTNITLGNTCHAKLHASGASGYKEDFNIFLGLNPRLLFLVLAAILFIGTEPF